MTTSLLPARLRSAWIRFVWTAKGYVTGVLADTTHSSFRSELVQADASLPAGALRHYFFHSIHPDSVSPILDAKRDELKEGRARLNIVLRADPPTGKGLARLMGVLNEISKDENLRRSISFLTDTDRLAEAYDRLSPLRFRCLPIPLELPQLDEGRLAKPGSTGKTRLTLAFLGDARREKGYHLLPGMVRELSDLFEEGRVQLVHQCSFPVVGGEPGMAEARAELESLPGSWTRAFPDPLPIDDYFDLLGTVDLIVLPYDTGLYSARSSGVLAEALAFGIPAVVPDNTWMSDQIRGGLGEVFATEDQLAAAVRRAVENWQDRRTRCLENQGGWRERHSAKRLVDMLF
ncbi:glycosyltransferase [Hoeflea sp.]|uniref:glycosyltransferase n=1 Tax=Hoeflea sp. TaxID=1940281 RepID=UPI003B529FE7